MKNHLKIFFFFFLLSLPLWCSASQPDSIRVWFSVIDNFTKRDIGGARLELMRSDSVVFKTDSIPRPREIISGSARLWYEGGVLVMKLPGAGRYVVKLSADGYEVKTISFTIPVRKYGKWVRDWQEKFVLNRASDIHTVNLGEAVVKATRIKMVMKGDTVVYNADAFNLSSGSMLDELIKALPGMKIDADGQITHNGERVEELLVNGKDFFKGNPKIALDNLPAYVVDQLKVYRKSPKDAYLMKDTMEVKRQRKLVVDVNLKRQYNQGWIANVEGATGTYDRFLSRFFAMRYTDHSKLFVFGNSNNINSDARPGSNGEWDRYRNETGTMTTQNGGINFNVDDKNTKLEYQASLDAIHRNRRDESAVSGVRYFSGGDAYNRSYNRSRDRSNDVTFRQHIEQPMDNIYWHIESSAYIRNGKGRNMGRSGSFNIDPADAYRGASLDSIFAPAGSLRLQRALITRMLNESYSENNSFGLHLNAYFGYTTPLLGNTGKLGFDFNFNDNHSHVFSLSDLRQPQAGAADYRHEFTRLPAINHSFNVFHDYDWTFSRLQDVYYKVGYSFNSDFNRGHRDLFRLDSLNGWGSGDHRDLRALPSTTDSLHAAQDRRNSYHTVNRNNTHTLNMDVRVNLGKTCNLLFKAPVRFRHASISDVRNGMSGRLSRNLASVEPAVSFGCCEIEPGKTKMYSVSCTTSTSMPALSNMLSIIDDSNPLVVQLGNDKLKNTHSYNLRAWYYHTQSHRQKTLSGKAEWRVDRHSVGQAMTYDRTTGISTFKPRNIDGNWSTHADFYYGAALDSAARWTFNTSLECDYSNSADFFTETGGLTSSPYRSSVRNAGIRPGLGSTMKIGKAELSAFGSLRWHHVSSRRANFTNISSYEYRYGLDCRTPLAWGVDLNTGIVMYSRRGYSDPAMNDDNLVWNAVLTRTFFKNKSMTFKLEGFDLLGQLNNVRSEVNAQGRTETWTNTFPRYVMLRIIYRLDMLPKNKREKK